MSLLSIGKFAKKAGVHPETLKRLEKKGSLVPSYKSEAGTRYYDSSQLSYFRNKKDDNTKLTVGYCRVSTRQQSNDLEKQVENVKGYMIAKGYEFDIITDIGSGINYNKKGLLNLLEQINDQEIERVVVLYKDRLVRFGFELIEHLCEINNVELVVIDHTEKSKEEELTDDLIQIVTVFANRLYGSRSKKTKNLLKEVKANVDSQED